MSTNADSTPRHGASEDAMTPVDSVTSAIGIRIHAETQESNPRPQGVDFATSESIV